MTNFYNVYIRKILNVFLSNLFNFFGSVIVTLFLPLMLSVEEYGEWQYFLLLFTYIEIFQFGFAQGIYLRYGGEYFCNLNLRSLKNQIFLLISIITVVSTACIYINYSSGNKSLLIFLFCIPIMCWRCFSDYLMQAVGMTDEYSKIIIIDKCVFVLMIISTNIIIGNTSSIVIFVDFVFSKIVSCICSAYYLKKLICAKNDNFRFTDTIKEIFVNVSIGYKLIFSSLCSLLIVGIVRFTIVEAFGKDSYGRLAIILSICGFVMVLVNAISIVIFPNLRRMLKNNVVDFGKIYESYYKFFNICMLFLLLFAYPLEFIIKNYLIKYASSVSYLYILMPIVIFDSNWAIFGATIMKLFRKEEYILKITLTSVIVSALFSFILFYFVNNLLLYSYLIVFVLGFRLLCTELYIRKIFGINLIKYNIMLVIFIVLYIILNNYCDKFISIVFFMIYIILMLIINKKYIKECIKSVRCIS